MGNTGHGNYVGNTEQGTFLIVWFCMHANYATKVKYNQLEQFALYLYTCTTTTYVNLDYANVFRVSLDADTEGRGLAIV